MACGGGGFVEKYTFDWFRGGGWWGEGLVLVRYEGGRVLVRYEGGRDIGRQGGVDGRREGARGR